jgi:hypothetical protein
MSLYLRNMKQRNHAMRPKVPPPPAPVVATKVKLYVPPTRARVSELFEAIRTGVGIVGKECKLANFVGDPTAPRAVDALGAAAFVLGGDASAYLPQFAEVRFAYWLRYGVTISYDNDHGMEIKLILRRLVELGE